VAGVVRVAACLYGAGKNLLAETAETIVVLPQVDAGAACQQVTWVGALPAGLSPAAANPHSRVLGVARPGSLSANDWEQLLAAVTAGNVAILGPIQQGDQTALAALAERGLELRVEMGIGSWMGCYHWIAASPLFAGLPAGGLAGEAYTSVLPHYILTEQGGDVLAGSLRNTNSRFEKPAMLWYSDVEAVAYGKGTLLFCQYRVFDQATTNPLAARLLCNLIGVATRGKEE
jgi:hypothetical protein